MVRPLLIALAALPLVACGGDDMEAKGPSPLPVEIARVSGPTTTDRVTATGAFEREREMALSFRIPGVIRSLTVDDGDVVRAGQVIAALDPTQVAAGARQAEVELERVRRDLARDEQLAAKGYVSKARLEDRRSAVRVAQAAYDAAAFDRRWANLSSPVSGVVLRRGAQAGEVVQPGQAVVAVADVNSPLVLRVSVPDADAARIRPGAGASVRLGNEAIAGQVSRVGQQVQAGTGVVDIEIRVPARPDLRSGLIASAEIETLPAVASAPSFARVPAEAILEATGGKAAVFRLDEKAKVARRTPVSFGGFDGDDALVGGLAPGSAVITAGAGYLSDGQAVAVVDPAALARAAR